MFGGTAPLPLRLTASDDGWTPEQFLRAAADVAAMRRTVPLAIMAIARSGSSPSPIITAFRSSIGLTASDITLSGNHGTTAITVSFPQLVSGLPITIQSVKVSPQFYTNPSVSARVTNNTTVTLYLGRATGIFGCTLSVFADHGEAREAGDYGAFRNKIASAEEPIPHAYVWYQELDAALGSAYSGRNAGSVHARKLALGRALQLCMRSEEKLRAQSTPQSATTHLMRWATIVDAPRRDDDKDWKLRQRVQAFYAARGGGSLADLERSIISVIGDYYIRTLVIVDNPWDQSQWPKEWDTGSGVWASNTCRFIVHVRPPKRPLDPEWSRLITVDLHALLDRLTNSAADFSWAVPGDGFQLGVDKLGVDAL